MKRKFPIIPGAMLLLSLFFAACDGQESGGGSHSPGGTMSNETDSLSYVIGLNIAQGTKQDNIEINPDMVYQGLADGLDSSKTPMMTMEQAQQYMMAYNARMQRERMQANSQAAGQNMARSQQFLEENKAKENVVTHESGLQYIVLTPGNGKSPTLDDRIKINYTGRLIDGTEFDSSEKSGGPVTFPLRNLIKGWQIALPMMKEGAKWQLFIPPQLGYGEQAPPNIGPNQALIFDIELVEVNPQEAAPAGPGN